MHNREPNIYQLRFPHLFLTALVYNNDNIKNNRANLIRYKVGFCTGWAVQRTGENQKELKMLPLCHTSTDLLSPQAHSPPLPYRHLQLLTQPLSDNFRTYGDGCPLHWPLLSYVLITICVLHFTLLVIRMNSPEYFPLPSKTWKKIKSWRKSFLAVFEIGSGPPAQCPPAHPLLPVNIGEASTCHTVRWKTKVVESSGSNELTRGPPELVQYFHL